MKITLKNLQQQSFTVDIEPTQTVNALLLGKSSTLSSRSFVFLSGEEPQAEN